MKKLTVIALLTLQALTLSACGGGSSSDSTRPNTNPQPLPAGMFQGVALTGSAEKNLGSDDLEILKVNGRSIVLSPPPGFLIGGITKINNGTFNGKHYPAFVVSGLNYQASKFGFIIDQATGPDGVVFSQGQLTKDMPAQGMATYKGHSVYSKGNQFDTGDAIVNVDFGNKQLQAELKNQSSNSSLIYNHKFAATIDKNTFKADDPTLQAHGYFYGAEANEVGGIFRAKDQSFKGSFGAIKQ